MDARTKLMEMIEPAVNDMGYELIEIEYRPPGGRRGMLRLYLDRTDGGITLDDCERVSNEVSAMLDVTDPIGGEYVLEVSSPGEDRILRTRRHFEDFAGHRVRVQLKTMQDGRRKITGELVGVENDEIVLRADGETVKVALEGIARARLAPQAAN